jgi:hypothetical protein
VAQGLCVVWLFVVGLVELEVKNAHTWSGRSARRRLAFQNQLADYTHTVR